MLRSLGILLLLVVAVLAASQNAWEEGKEYTYKVRSRTLAAVNPQSKQYSGILTKARLTVQWSGQDTLRAKVSQPRYSRIHTRLQNGWESEIPESQLSMSDVPLSQQPFEIKMKNGVVQELVVNADVPTWEVNMLKSIVSQLQVDTQGQNALRSKQNHLPEGKQPIASFKTMEDSVGGKCEVLYDVSPLTQQALQNKPELVPMPLLKNDDEMISLVKTKNFSRCSHRVSYHVGVNGRNKFEPGDNDNGRILSRSSVSRIVITGKLKKYTIQSSITNNKIVLNPDQQENQQGMVVSKMNVTLQEIKDTSEPLPAPTKPQSVGNLVYNYNNPFESSSSRRPNVVDKNQDPDEQDSSNESSSKESNDADSYLQSKPTLTEAPRNPMLPFFVGNNGNSIQTGVDAVKSAKDIAKEIGDDMQRPDSMQREQTLEKFTILSRLVRTMSAQQIDQAQSELYEPEQSSNQLDQEDREQRKRRNAWVAFRDAVANAGTGPALVNIKQWIQSKKILNAEAAMVVGALAKSAQTPTPDFMDALFEIVTMPETKEQPQLRDASVMALAELSRHAIVNKRSAHNRFPVHVFGKVFGKSQHNLHKKYIPYMIEQLQEAVKTGDSDKIQVYSVALGKIGHPRILSVFEPYIEGRKQVSPFQRLVMVMSLEKLASTYPKSAQLVLYKIYSNSADNHEIRSAAVFMLMKTKPSASMLQRMAESTNYESSKHVNSAVKSSIESLAQLEGDEMRELADAARTALPLLTPEKFGVQYSRAVFRSFKNPRTHSGLSVEAKMIGSDDSIIPKGVSITISPVVNGLKLTEINAAGAVSTVQDLWNFIEKQLGLNQKNGNSGTEEKSHAAEDIAKLLGIQGDEPKQIEGFIRINEKNLGSYFLAFNNRSLERLPQQLNELEQIMSQGLNLHKTKFDSSEVTISFPTETGYPMSFTLKTPTVMGISEKSKSKVEHDSEKHSSILKSATINEKLKLVYGLRVQKRLGFVVPFDRQEFMAGVDRTMQLYLPIHSEVSYDRSKKNYRMKLQFDDVPQNDENDRGIKLVQVETKPFTANHDILSLKPVSNDKDTHVLKKDRASSSKVEVKDDNGEPRALFEWTAEPDFMFLTSEYEKNIVGAMKMARSVAHLVTNSDLPNTKFEKYSIKVTPSSDLNLEMRASYDSVDNDNDNSSNENDSGAPLNAKAPAFDKNFSETERKQKLLEKAAKNINSARAKVVDVNVKVNGPMKSSATVTAAIANSAVDEKSRIVAFGTANVMWIGEYHGALEFESKTPSVETLDYEETLKANTGNDYDAEIHYGPGADENDSKGRHHTIRIKGHASQTEERRNEIRRSREAEMCAKIKNQKKLSAVCQKLNEQAAKLNKGEIDVSFEDDSSLRRFVMSALDSVEKMARIIGQTEKDRQNETEKNKVRISIEMSPKNQKAGISLKTSEGKIELHNIDLSWLNEDDEQSNENIEDIQNNKLNPLRKNRCSLDKSEAKTFDNKRYSVQLGQCWHVAMVPYPKNDPDNRNQRMDIPENMEVVILAKDNENGDKKLKVILGKDEIKLSPSSSGKPEATLADQPMKISKKQSASKRQNGKIVFEVFRLSDDSIKLLSTKYNIEVIYDGSRAQIKAGERYRNSVRGLCGNDDGEPDSDQQTPKGCQLRKPEEFAATWALVDKTCQGPARQNAKKAQETEKSSCTRETYRPGNVINYVEAGREDESRENDNENDNDKNQKHSSKHCMHHRTKVQKTDDEICFSTRPIPVCSSSCRLIDTRVRSIDMHCVPRTSAAERVANRVESGANPDLMQKKVSKTITEVIPIICKP